MGLFFATPTGKPRRSLPSLTELHAAATASTVQALRSIAARHLYRAPGFYIGLALVAELCIVYRKWPDLQSVPANRLDATEKTLWVLALSAFFGFAVTNFLKWWSQRRERLQRHRAAFVVVSRPTHLELVAYPFQLLIWFADAVSMMLLETLVEVVASVVVFAAYAALTWAWWYYYADLWQSPSHFQNFIFAGVIVFGFACCYLITRVTCSEAKRQLNQWWGSPPALPRTIYRPNPRGSNAAAPLHSARDA